MNILENYEKEVMVWDAMLLNHFCAPFVPAFEVLYISHQIFSTLVVQELRSTKLH